MWYYLFFLVPEIDVYVWTGVVRNGIDTVKMMGQIFNIKKFINERNSTVGINNEIIHFPDKEVQPW